MKLLVRVVSIRPVSLVVSLPNQLLGHIPITQISTKYTDLLDSYEKDDRTSLSGDGEVSQHGSCIPELDDLFKPGQFLAAVVIAVHSRAGIHQIRENSKDELLRASQRVELSTIPSLVNDSITPEHLINGAVSL